MQRMIIWTAYMRYRACLRCFDLTEVERIVRYSSERYSDEATGRQVVVGRHGESLVVVPIETQGKKIIPITVHRTTRRQIATRLKSGRYAHA